MRHRIVIAGELLLFAELSFGANRVVRDVSYGADPQQRFDVYAPLHARAAPVILMVHGGGWTRGDKAIARMYENKVAHWRSRASDRANGAAIRSDSC